MKNFFIAILFCTFFCKSMEAMLKTIHKPVQQTGVSSFLTPKNFCIAVGLTAGGWGAYKYYQLYLETKRLKDEEEKKRQEMQENLNRATLEEKLRLACISGSAEIVQEALEGRASCNKRFSDEITPLMLASMYGYHLIVQKLLRYDADCLLKDVHGKSAYDYALENEQKDALRLLKNAATTILREEAYRSAVVDNLARIRDAIAAGADVNANGVNGLPLIQIALLNFNEEFIAELICQGAEYPLNIVESVSDEVGEHGAQCVKKAIEDRRKKTVRALAAAQLKEQIKNNGQSLQLT